MGLPGKRDEPIRAGITAIVFMNRSYDRLLFEGIKNYTQKLLADYQVFFVSWAILIVKIKRYLACCNFIVGTYGYAAGNWIVARVEWRVLQNLLFKLEK